MASRSASANLSSIHCVGFQPIVPSARRYRIASPACSNSCKTSETRACLPFGGRARFPLLARDIDPEFQLFGHPQFHFLQPVRRSYAFEISVCLSVASGMRQTLLKLGAREVALSNISQRTPRRPRFSRVFCFRRAPPHESAQLCREDALGYSVAVTPMDHSALNRCSFRQSRGLRTSHPRVRSQAADPVK
jgi:hypothetical protein